MILHSIGMRHLGQLRYARSGITRMVDYFSHRGRGSGLPGFGLGNIGICMIKNDPVTVGPATTSSRLQATEG